MDFDKVSAERDKYPPDSIEYKVLTCFLTQPRRVGPSGDRTRPINFENPDDRRMFWNAVAADYDRVYKAAGFQTQPRAVTIYEQGWELFGWTARGWR